MPVPWLLLEDLLPARRHRTTVNRSSRWSAAGLQLATLRSRAHKTLYYQLQFNQRGYYQIGPLMLETGDLFGLHRRYRMLTEPHFVLVYPEVVPLEGYDLARGAPSARSASCIGFTRTPRESPACGPTRPAIP